MAPPRIAVTPGEPAGIGPDLVVTLAQQARDYELVALGDPELLLGRSEQLGLSLTVREYKPDARPNHGAPGELIVDVSRTHAPVTPGQLDVRNSPYVLSTLRRAVNGCLEGEFAAMVTAPVQKSILAESGTVFSGHTEFLAELCDVKHPVMLLCAGNLRVALLTTHLALRDVPAHISTERVITVSTILAADLERLFGISRPRIAILGLNPHAGEAGQLGREEIESIEPAIAQLSAAGVNVHGPVPADSAFTPDSLAQADAILAMYHDQGLPVLKHAGFGGAINVTLGLPIVRTSVDHGTALDLAGSGKANADSLLLAVQMAQQFSQRLARQGR